MSAKEIERFLYNECGLKGLSGISNDVRDLLASKDLRAKLALDHFVYRISLYAGMLASAMGGIDGFVFTAGIGENAPAIREAVAERLAWLGLDFDREANASGKISDLTRRLTPRLLRHPHRRGADDRPPHARRPTRSTQRCLRRSSHD